MRELQSASQHSKLLSKEARYQRTEVLFLVHHPCGDHRFNSNHWGSFARVVEHDGDELLLCPKKVLGDRMVGCEGEIPRSGSVVYLQFRPGSDPHVETGFIEAYMAQPTPKGCQNRKQHGHMRSTYGCVSKNIDLTISRAHLQVQKLCSNCRQ